MINPSSREQKVNILHVITGLGIGGTEMALYQLLKHSNRKDFHHTVVSLTNHGPVGDLIQNMGITTKALGLRKSIMGLKGIFEINSLFQEQRPHLIKTWMYHANFIGGIASRLNSRTPVIWGLHHTDLDVNRDPLTTRAIARLSGTLSHHIPASIVCCSYAAKNAHIKLGYAEEKMMVIPIGFDTSQFAPDPDAKAALQHELDLGPRTSLIGMASRFHPQKDHYTFVAAARNLHENYPDIHFILCGDGVEPQNHQLQDWIDQNGMERHIHLLGRRTDMPHVFAALDIATLSSHGESFPLVIGEAMSCGTPCVATNVGDASLIIDDTGVIVPPENPHALAQGWLQIISLEPEEREQLGAAARNRIQERFSIETVVQKYEDLYHKYAAYRQ